MSKSLINHIGSTPLIPLMRISAGLRHPIYAKCDFLNPGGSVKDRLAKAIIDDGEARGVLKPGMTMIEATAGNTGMGLAIIAAIRGYKLVCVLPEKMSVDKRIALKSLGARVIVTKNAPPSSPDNFRQFAQKLASENGWYHTDQFRNPVNVKAHAATTGPEIFEQLSGKVGAFVAGAGTGGTISGVGQFLKSVQPDVKIILADPVGSSFADWIDFGKLGTDSAYEVEGIGGSEVPENLHCEVIDLAERVSDEESFAMTHRLIREEGLLVGGSSGTNVAAALRFAQTFTGTGPVVTILPDAWDRYRAKPWLQNVNEMIY